MEGRALEVITDETDNEMEVYKRMNKEQVAKGDMEST